MPDVFIWWPPDAVAGLGSLRKLAKTGVPVLKINQLPNEQDKEYIFGYAGPDDRLRAYNAGEMMVKAITYVKTVRESAEKEGIEQNVELQICAMGIEPFDKSGDHAKGLYETKVKEAPKATSVAQTTTYLA